MRSRCKCEEFQLIEENDLEGNSSIRCIKVQTKESNPLFFDCISPGAINFEHIFDNGELNLFNSSSLAPKHLTSEISNVIFPELVNLPLVSNFPIFLHFIKVEISANELKNSQSKELAVQLI